MINKVYNPNTKQIIEEKPGKIMVFLYNNAFGRIILKIIINPIFSKFFGFLTNTKISKLFINKFVKNNNINMEDYPVKKYLSFNDFFTRKIINGKRPFSSNKNDLISPADSKLSVYKIDENTTIKVKNSYYTISSLIQDEKLASVYQNGYCLVFRLSVDDYHHYSFIDDGNLNFTKQIKGKLHTVNPIAFYKYPVFLENHRVISSLSTKNFGNLIYIEVGALNVGKIHNLNQKEFKKGEEKGYFSFGASTIILIFPKDTIILDQIYTDNSQKDIETKIKLGQTIGHKK